jgi:hypothetical protein
MDSAVSLFLLAVGRKRANVVEIHRNDVAQAPINVRGLLISSIRALRKPVSSRILLVQIVNPTEGGQEFRIGREQANWFVESKGYRKVPIKKYRVITKA